MMQTDLSYEILWHSGSVFSSMNNPRPNWSGFMQATFPSNDSQYGKSDIFLFPIIDLPPTDPTCIYSTLLFIVSQAQKLNIDTPCITFDQPLWSMK